VVRGFKTIPFQARGLGLACGCVLLEGEFVMLRVFACSVALLALVLLTQARAQEDKNPPGAKNEHVTKATIVKVDPAKQCVTVRMKDKTGKEVERTIELKGGVKAFNERGEATAVNVFREGSNLYVVEREERVFELRATPERKQPPNK
jgi:hypothetical protein